MVSGDRIIAQGEAADQAFQAHGEEIHPGPVERRFLAMARLHGLMTDNRSGVRAGFPAAGRRRGSRGRHGNGIPAIDPSTASDRVPARRCRRTGYRHRIRWMAPHIVAEGRCCIA